MISRIATENPENGRVLEGGYFYIQKRGMQRRSLQQL